MIYAKKMLIFSQSKKKTILMFLFSFILFASYSQDVSNLSDGYKDYKFGLDINTIKNMISKGIDFDPVREEILTIRTEPDRQIITVRGKGFIKRAYFHFNEDKLFHIYIIMNENKIGYYNLLKGFTEKFGNPTLLEPKKSTWKNDLVRIVVEKPSVVKYTSLPVWDSLGSTDLTDRNALQMDRDKFISDM